MAESRDIAARVEREKASHDSDDVLARAYALKNRFGHIWKVTERVREREGSLLRAASGKLVLDYGCGRGEYSLELLGLGANVVGIDISQAYVDKCNELCLGAGYEPSRFKFQVMDAHKLEFGDECFDYVVGNGILHHLDYPTALREIHRVLRPGGRAIFQEPLADNPLLKLLRKLTPRARTDDEKPFSGQDLKYISTQWSVESSYFGLIDAPVAMATSLVLRPWPRNPFLAGASLLDGWLDKAGILHSWNQYVLFNLVKPK